MYEQSSIRLELLRQRHDEWIAEARHARLAASVERSPSRTLLLAKSALSAVTRLTSHRPTTAPVLRVQPTA